MAIFFDDGKNHHFRKDYAVAKQGGRVKITLARESAAFTDKRCIPDQQ
jgi:hypothetical protein